MIEGVCDADLNDVQRAWLKKCGMRVEPFDLPDMWRITIVRDSRIIMRNIAYGSRGDADTAGRKLAYRAALAYVPGRVSRDG